MKLFIILLLLCFFLFPFHAFAKSSYVLPYPSVMPGNKLYFLNNLKDRMESFWYFGDIAQFTYHLKMTDKYLVEAKTLFEYDQYLLAQLSLKKSDLYFQKLFKDVKKAKDRGKKTTQIEDIYKQASEKHIEVLEKLEDELPEDFLWQPEKDKNTDINIKELLENSIKIRQ